jgi:hypothetical protein
MNINTRDLSFLNFNTEEMQWLKYNNLLVWEAWQELIASGIPPLTLNKCKGVDLVDYKIYGNSVQDGTPTPDTPIEVESVGERTKNLIKFKVYGHENTDRVGNVEELKALVSQGYDVIWSINVNTSGITYEQANTYFLVSEVKPNTEYSLSGYTKNSVFEYDENFNYVQTLGAGIGSGSNSSSVSFTTSENAKYLMVYIYNKAQAVAQQPYTLEEIKNMNQLEEGSTATDYEPYGYKIPVKVNGKNLINKETLLDGYVKSDGTMESASWYKCTDYLSVSGDYIYLQNTTVSSSTLRHIVFFDKDKNVISSQAQQVDDNKTTIAMPEGTAFVRLNIAPSNVTKVMVSMTDFEKYEPYIEPTTTNIYLNEPLRKVGEYADYVDFANKKVIRNIAILTEINNFASIYKKMTNVIRLGAYLPDIVPSKMGTYEATCNFLPYKSAWLEDTEYIFKHSGTSYHFYMSFLKTRLGVTDEDTDAQILEKANSYISTMPNKKIYYPLETPTEETIELPNIPTLKGTTILSVDTTIQPSNAEVVYMGNGKKQLLEEESNLILNEILATNTETELNMTNTEINKILDEIIGG